MAFGGRIAEELVFGYDKVTTGAQSDIEMATRMARAMVTRFGMSDELGPIAYAENQEEVFLGHSISRQQNVSEATAQKIDLEVRRIIDDTYKRAQKILKDRIDDLHVLAKGLLEYETLTGDEIKALLRGERPVRTPYEEPEPAPQTRPAATVPSSGRSREPGGIHRAGTQPGTWLPLRRKAAFPLVGKGGSGFARRSESRSGPEGAPKPARTCGRLRAERRGPRLSGPARALPMRNSSASSTSPRIRFPMARALSRSQGGACACARADRRAARMRSTSAPRPAIRAPKLCLLKSRSRA